MPSYTNSNSTTVFSGDSYIKLEPGVTVTDKYIRDLPTGVTLTAHTPLSYPWVLLSTVTSYPSSSISVAPYNGLIINNETNGTIIVEANGDTANALRLMGNTQSFFDISDRKTGSLKALSSTGTSGAVYIYAQG
jgi:hypothetical protein